jgi:hypothetical protein
MEAADKPRERRDGDMRFLIKVAFWLTIVVLLLPADSAKQGQATQVGALEALGAAQAAVEDASGFCARNPDACEVGSQAFQTFGEKAQHGARLLYEFLSARFSGPDDAPPQVTTGSIKMPHRPGRHTLEPSDLEPQWSGPEPKSVPLPPKRPA